MSIEITVPAVGESINEVFIGEWYVSEGDTVAADQDVVGLETEKATFDVPAPNAGVLAQIMKKAGETAAIGDVIAVLEPVTSDSAADPAPAAAPQSGKTAERESTERAPAESGAKQPATATTAEAHVMPAAGRLLAEHGLSSDQVEATGPGGRLLKEDVLRHLSMQQPDARVGGGSFGGNGQAARREKRVPMSPMRRTIAARLVEAQQTAALLTTFNEADMSGIKELRARHGEAFQKKYDVKLGFMSFFVKAVVDALGEYPQVGATVEGNELVYRDYCDIGIAIGSGKGLVVPVLRNAERLSLAEIEQQIGEFAARAKKNKISLEELEGGTFTISNGGIYGSMLSTPIVNPPQSGVLGMHNIVDRPVVVNGEIVIRPIMYLALTYDHRVVDGREAVSFLRRIKETLEEPARLLLEV